jgi:HD-GYP domain-containing protein (c-di-GMP phosphodiesterase class II)
MSGGLERGRHLNSAFCSGMFSKLYGSEDRDLSDHRPIDGSSVVEALAEIWPRRTRAQIEAVFEQWQHDLDIRDSYSGIHSQLAAQQALTLARRLQLPPDLVGGLWVAGHVYDLGKNALPPDLLRKEGPLNNAELIALRSHVSIGYDLLRDWDILRNCPHWLHDLVLEVVLFHHERWDGAGYLKGKHGDAIPLHARIMAIADAFTAMILDSPYRHARSPKTALEEITARAGEQFDPYLVQQFVRAVRLEQQQKSFTLPEHGDDSADTQLSSSA